MPLTTSRPPTYQTTKMPDIIRSARIGKSVAHQFSRSRLTRRRFVARTRKRSFSRSSAANAFTTRAPAMAELAPEFITERKCQRRSRRPQRKRQILIVANTTNGTGTKTNNVNSQFWANRTIKIPTIVRPLTTRICKPSTRKLFSSLTSCVTRVTSVPV